MTRPAPSPAPTPGPYPPAPYSLCRDCGVAKDVMGRWCGVPCPLHASAPALLAALMDLLDCVECDDIDKPKTERTYYLDGYVTDAIAAAIQAIAAGGGA